MTEVTASLSPTMGPTTQKPGPTMGLHPTAAPTSPPPATVRPRIEKLDTDLGKIFTSRIPHQEEHLADIGRMSAEAVTMQYEATAESVEQLGNMIRDFAPRLEAELKEFDRNLKLIEKAANHVREKGKHIQSLIKEASQLSKTMRHTCEDVVKKVVGDSDTL